VSVSSTEGGQEDGGAIARVSIGLPVYNGDEFLEEALDSLLGQTYRDFELIISDNASTDRTQEICERYASSDPRIRYSRNAENIGPIQNSNLTFQMARTEYFRFAAHDDCCAPTMLERLVDEMDRRPEVVNCYSATVLIDADGNQTGFSYRNDAFAARPSQRLRVMLAVDGLCLATYGLLRSDILRRTLPEQNYTSGDHAFLAELALRGRFHLVPELLFYKRKHPGNIWRDPIRQMVWFRPELARTGRPTFPRWMEFAGYIRAVQRVPLPSKERAKCLLWIGRWAFRRRRALAREPAFAVKMLLHSPAWRRSFYARGY
jgi:glycosyltransferase involved in cell wall biosynthesis